MNDQRWNLKKKRESIERQLILQVFQRTSTREEARQLLGLSKQGLNNKIRRYALDAIAIRTYPICPQCGQRGKSSRGSGPM